MVNQRFRKNIFEYHVSLYSKYFRAARVYLMTSSLHVDPGVEVFCLNSVVRGYHVYKDILSSVHGEELHCKREIGNVHDLYAVSVIKHGTGIVGHLPKGISTPCHLFLRKGGNISCIVNGRRQYSSDLPQGGLEVPCRLIFKGNKKDIDKIKLLLQKSNKMSVETKSEVVDVEKCSELIDCTVDKDVFLAASNSEHTWVQANKCTLTLADKKTLLTFGSSLTDKHVNYAQALLRHQFTNDVTGLQSTLLQYKPLIKKWAEGLQIIHCHGCHWVVAHKETASTDIVKVYDTLYDVADDVMIAVLLNLFAFSTHGPTIEMIPMQKQTTGSNNCGVFAVAICVAILLKKNPSCIVFDENKMRPHLCSCFEEKCMSRFPYVQ